MKDRNRLKLKAKEVFKKCMECCIVMQGIPDYCLRERCEDCGGNSTKFNETNPWKRDTT